MILHNGNVRKGDRFTCKYPKHGRLNILKRHKGTVEKLGVSDNGVYLTLREAGGAIRTLSVNKMIEPVRIS
jgi:hypothetical protein